MQWVYASRRSDRLRYSKQSVMGVSEWINQCRLVSWSLTSLFSTNMAISETKSVQVRRAKSDPDPVLELFGLHAQLFHLDGGHVDDVGQRRATVVSAAATGTDVIITLLVVVMTCSVHARRRREHTRSIVTSLALTGSSCWHLATTCLLTQSLSLSLSLSLCLCLCST